MWESRVRALTVLLHDNIRILKEKNTRNLSVFMNVSAATYTRYFFHLFKYTEIYWNHIGNKILTRSSKLIWV